MSMVAGIQRRERHAPGRALFGGLRRAALPVGIGVFIAALAAASGGYFAPSWNWTALLCLWAIAVATVAIDPIRMSRLEGHFVLAAISLTIFASLSSAWSDGTNALLDSQRLLAYATMALVTLIVVRRRNAVQALAATLAAIVAVCSYSLLERLLPDRLGVFDPVAGYRLAGPIGYWNGLGIFATLGIILALGFVARATSLLARAASAAAAVVLVATVYFTFGRAAYGALAAGLLLTITLEYRRLQFLSALFATALPSTLVVWAATRQTALTHRTADLSAAIHEGRRFLLLTVAAALAAALLAVLFGLFGERVAIGKRVGRAVAVILILSACLAAVTAAHHKSPSAVAHRLYRSFESPLPTSANLNQRLLSVSSNGRIDMWRVALRDYNAHRVGGSGSGSYEEWWNRTRPTTMQVRDAHSLYVETLAELGPFGLLLILTIIIAPLVAAIRARKHPLIPATAGAYAAWAVHAGVDWDWELTGVTSAALLCGCILLIAARKEEQPWALTPRVRAAIVATTLALAGGVIVLLVGNTAVASARDAAVRGDWRASAAHARKAKHWMPWSADPWRMLGEAQLALREPQAAATLRKAAAKDPNNWLTWFDLAAATNGIAHRRALARARALNPLSPEIKQLYGS